MKSEEPISSSEDFEPYWQIGPISDSGGAIVYGEGRRLNDSEVDDYRFALEFVTDRLDQAAFKLVVGNYREFRALQASLFHTITTSEDWNRIDLREPTFHLRRSLLNWLNSIRLLDDHALASITRLFGKGSEECARYKNLRSEQYDENFWYRFAFELRNYAQHCGQVPLQGNVTADRDGRKLALYFDRDELLRKFDKGKRVERGLKDGPDRLGIDECLEGAMQSILAITLGIAQIERSHFDGQIATMRRIVGPTPVDPKERLAIYRFRPFVDEDGAESMRIDLLTAVEITETVTTPDQVVKVDFGADRPQVRIADSYMCQGPIDGVTHLPSERCGGEATTGFFFPHQGGVAFAFACSNHDMELGRWIGRTFGGCFGGEVAKTPFLMEEAAKKFVSLDTPHGEEFRRLVRVPGSPEVQSPLKW